MGWILLLTWLIGCFFRVWLHRIKEGAAPTEGETDG